METKNRKDGKHADTYEGGFAKNPRGKVEADKFHDLTEGCNKGEKKDEKKGDKKEEEKKSLVQAMPVAQPKALMQVTEDGDGKCKTADHFGPVADWRNPADHYETHRDGPWGARWMNGYGPQPAWAAKCQWGACGSQCCSSQQHPAVWDPRGLWRAPYNAHADSFGDSTPVAYNKGKAWWNSKADQYEGTKDGNHADKYDEGKFTKDAKNHADNFEGGNATNAKGTKNADHFETLNNGGCRDGSGNTDTTTPPPIAPPNNWVGPWNGPALNSWNGAPPAAWKSGVAPSWNGPYNSWNRAGPYGANPMWNPSMQSYNRADPRPFY